jgi:hypothetical protein
MNVKAKAIGLLAGSALVLSLGASVAAEPIQSQVLLTEENCSFYIRAWNDNVNFGEYRYDGYEDKFVPWSEILDGRAQFNLEEHSTHRKNACVAEVLATPLQHVSATDPIAVSLEEEHNSSNVGNPLIVTIAARGTASIIAKLPSELSSSYPIGTYHGTVTVTEYSGN